MQGLLRFGAVWLPIGFVTGTLTLLGPIRWLTAMLREGGRSQDTENAIVTGVIVLWIALSGLLSWWVARRWARGRGAASRFGVPLALVAGVTASVAMWMNPGILGPRGEVRRAAGERFVFGPYPAEAQMHALREQGYAGVITLLHPAVVPFEPKLLADERAAARAAGIPLIELPMLPWISDNTEVLDSLRSLAGGGGGPYYVHCYLGRDRVNVARQVLRRAGGVGASAPPARPGPRLADKEQFERGGLIHLDSALYLTPFPTDEELLVYFVASGTRTVVSLLDPDWAEDRPWIDRIRRSLGQYGVDFVPLPLPAQSFDPARALAIAEALRESPRPTVVHAFLTRSAAAEGVTIAYRTGLPPLPPSLFVEPMRHGAAEVVAPNVAIGPVPDPGEFALILRPRGVRGAIYVGSTPPPDGRAEAARAAGIEWSVGTPAEAARRVAGGGPWYLFGPGAEDARVRVTRPVPLQREWVIPPPVRATPAVATPVPRR